MTLDEAIRVRDRAAFSAPSQVDWAHVEQAVEVIARERVARETAQTRGTEPRGIGAEYDAAVKHGRGPVVSSGGRRVRRGYVVDENDYERRLEGSDDRAPASWAKP